MKFSILFLVSAVLLFASCNKGEQPKPAGAPTIIGVWTNENPADRNPTFTADSVFWNDNLTSERYILKSDTILVVYPDNSTLPRLTYTVSADNQTLTLFDYWLPTPTTYVYGRAN